MKAEAVIASAFVVFRLVRDVVANHKTTRFTGGSDLVIDYYIYLVYFDTFRT